MLSAESASGKYPIQSVATMARIIESAEKAHPVSNDISNWIGRQKGRTSRALCEAAAVAAQELGVTKTGVFTESGTMARRLSSVRPSQRIFALTDSNDVLNELSLVWGVEPLYHPAYDSSEEMLKTAEQTLLDAGVVEKGETMVVMAGRLSGLGLSSSVVVLTVGETVPRR
jgi:pyruvate kinase